MKLKSFKNKNIDTENKEKDYSKNKVKKNGIIGSKKLSKHLEIIKETNNKKKLNENLSEKKEKNLNNEFSNIKKLNNNKENNLNNEESQNIKLITGSENYLKNELNKSEYKINYR